MTPLPRGLSRKGFSRCSTPPHGREEGLEESRLLERFGIASAIVGADRVREMVGGIETRVLGGVFHPMDAHLDPRRFVDHLASQVRLMGVGIHESTEVIGFKKTGNRITSVQTTRGDMAAREVVLAGGAWSSVIAGDLGVDIPMQPAKGYSVTFERTEKCPEIPLGLMEAKVVLTPFAQTFRVAGTLEFAGLDSSYPRRRIQAVAGSVAAYFPDLDPKSMELVEIWRGFRPCSPDGLPYIGRPSGVDNLIVATGHGMLGITQAPISGKIVSQLAAGEQPALDITALRPDRFRRS